MEKHLLTCAAAMLVVLVVGSGIAGVAAQVQSQVQGRHLVELHEDNWELMLKGEWMVEFFAPWCPACKNLAPTWDRFATAALDANVNVAKIDVTTSPSLSGRFFVTALPTIYHVKDGEFRQYRGARDGDALMFFVSKKQWDRIQPISAWKKPNTVHMSVLSYFFKLSHSLKDFNVRLQEDYGLPTWGSYALFATGTIFVGAALGLILVCVVDFLYPPKKSQRQSFSETKERALNPGMEEIVSDEIEDDVPPKDDDDENEEDDDEDADEEEDDDGDNNEQDDDEDDDDEAGEEGSTSEGEKQSHSESEEIGNTTLAPTTAPTPVAEIEKSSAGPVEVDQSKSTQAEKSASPIEVRKRKPRKAD